MKFLRSSAALCLAALLAACGGDSGSGTAGPDQPPVASPSPSTPPQRGASCSMSARKSWALSQLREWYLFPDLLDTSVNPAAYPTVQSYIDALIAPAWNEGKDRGFTYLTSIAEETAYYSEGASAGFGILIEFSAAGELLVRDAFEGAPALAAGIDRGTRIVAIGTSETNLRPVSDILMSEGEEGVYDAFGPLVPGIARVFEIDNSQSSVPGPASEIVRVTKDEFALPPVSPRFGVEILESPGGERFGYVHLRTFIDTAEAPLVNAFGRFRAEGIDKVVIDVRDNGGGVVWVGELLGDLMGRDKAGEVFSRITHRPSKSDLNERRFFTPRPQSIAPQRLAFIGTERTASASEMVTNAMAPYLGGDIALVGADTFGKPVGQIALDQAACDDRLRVVAFRVENANGRGHYYNGLAETMQVFCRREEDLSAPLGSTAEPMIAEAAAYLEGGASACTRTAAAKTAQAARPPLPLPPRATTAQREMPGFF